MIYSILPLILISLVGNFIGESPDFNRILWPFSPAMYEANPMSFLIEQAGGASVNGKDRIMTLPAEKLHQRVSVVLGSKNEVDLIQRYHASF